MRRVQNRKESKSGQHQVVEISVKNKRIEIAGVEGKGPDKRRGERMKRENQNAKADRKEKTQKEI